MRVSEVYQSVQGEGPRVGMPTTFVRFGGCNLRCPGWPCDTQFAIDPQYRKEWLVRSVDDLLAEVPVYPKNVCLTGGEPMLQKADEVTELATRLYGRGHSVEMFSNGTLEYPEGLLDHCYVIMDWKLPGSGEDPDNTQRMDNFNRLSAFDSVKFTIADIEDFEVAQEIWKTHIADRDPAPMVFAGVVWGKLDNAELVQWILSNNLPWRYNLQVHNIIWDRSQRGI